jgi:hypothetical protein
MACREQRESRVRLDLRVKMVNVDSLGELDSPARLVPEVSVDPRELPEVLEPRARSVIPDFLDTRDLLEALELLDQVAYRELQAKRVQRVREVQLDLLGLLDLPEHEDWMVPPVVLVQPAKQATPVKLVLEVSLVHRDPRAELVQLGLLDQREQLVLKVLWEQSVQWDQVETKVFQEQLESLELQVRRGHQEMLVKPVIKAIPALLELQDSPEQPETKANPELLEPVDCLVSRELPELLDLLGHPEIKDRQEYLVR